MKDKVSELRKILNQKKTMEAKKHPSPQKESHEDKNVSPAKKAPGEKVLENEFADLKKKYEEIKKANEIQKDMYLRQVADLDNDKKRMQKEHEELVKYTNEKILEDIFPVIDSLEMTLSHVENKDDPIAKGVNLILKQLLQALEKHGVQQVCGEGEDFDPNLQEAIGTEKSEELKSGKVVKVHRKGYALNGKLIRAAMVTVSE